MNLRHLYRNPISLRCWKALNMLYVWESSMEDAIQEQINEDIDIDCRIVDHGIGQHEYSGSVEFDSRPEFEYDVLDGDSVVSWTASDPPDLDNLPTKWEGTRRSGYMRDNDVEAPIRVKSIAVEMKRHKVHLDSRLIRVTSYHYTAVVEWGPSAHDGGE